MTFTPALTAALLALALATPIILALVVVNMRRMFREDDKHLAALARYVARFPHDPLASR